MRFIGSVLLDFNGTKFLKVRNKTQYFIAPTEKCLDFLGDLRYYEVYMDFASNVHIEKPGGQGFILSKDMYDLYVRSSATHTLEKVVD